MIDMDKIARLRQKIERLRQVYYNKESEWENRSDDRHGYAIWYEGKVHMCDEILSSLGTLESEKPMNQDGLEEEMEEFFETMPVLEHENIFDETFQKIARHFAEWGAEHLRDTTKMIDNSLEEEIKRYIPRDQCPVPDFMEAVARHFAEWQKQQFEKNYKEIFNDYWTRGFEEGRADMKEQMLKDAIPFYEILKAVPSFERENTRIIIVKEEE